MFLNIQYVCTTQNDYQALSMSYGKLLKQIDIKHVSSPGIASEHKFMIIVKYLFNHLISSFSKQEHGPC